MKRPGILLAGIVLPCLLFLLPETAQAIDWQGRWDGTLYGYGNRTQPNDSSLLNPGNAVARLNELAAAGELRLNVKGSADALRVTARPILRSDWKHNAFGSERIDDAYLSQWQLRWSASNTINLAVGREVMNWGAAQFRSPSSPYYFDNGRSDPMRELTGMDSLKLTWTPVREISASIAWINRNGDNSAATDPWHRGWLGKFDLRQPEWAYGLVVAKNPDDAFFYGAHFQSLLDDAWLLYGEISSAELAGIPASKRRELSLVGFSYTFENGKTCYLEYLRNGHGMTATEQNSYFNLASVAPAAALASMPRLMGRDYLHLALQSNMMDEEGFWRLMATHNLTDHGSSLAGYSESVLEGRYSLFATGYWNFGDARQESAALVRGSITAGIKVALP